MSSTCHGRACSSTALVCQCWRTAATEKFVNRAARLLRIGTVVAVARNAVAVHLAIDRAPTEPQPHCGGTDVPVTGLERATQRIAFGVAENIAAFRVRRRGGND